MRYLYAKEIPYDIGRKKLISTKTLPESEKKSSLRVVSVKEVAQRYTPPKESLRYKGSDSVFFGPEEMEIVSKPKKIEDKIIVRKKVVRSKEELEKYISELEKYEKELHEKVMEFGVYEVVPGDVLSRIAKKFNMKTAELKSLNKLKNGSFLRIGQKLKIPFSQEMVDALSSGQYKVKEGDTLISIAKKFDLEVKELAEFNKLKKNATIRTDKVLELPLPYRLAQSRYGRKSMRVTATAYTSHVEQTDSTPFLAAWNNRLIPGMKIIAVSRDMLSTYGMRNGTKVRIAGLPGIYRVRDKMNKRYRKRIDIYMGLDRQRALKWGRRSVNIYWD
jgi:LysM repeat protein